jgi:hypothetical protein
MVPAFRAEIAVIGQKSAGHFTVQFWLLGGGIVKDNLV